MSSLLRCRFAQPGIRLLGIRLSGIRLCALLWICAIARAEAQPIGIAPFDIVRAADVFTEALGFLEPRVLEPSPVSVMTLWGLRGLSAIDFDLTVAVSNGRLRLTGRGRSLADLVAPNDETPWRWAVAAATVSAAATAASPQLQRVGTQGVIQAFFDELFNHLDPYSRYIAPADAEEDIGRRVGRGGLGMTLARQGNQTIAQTVIAESPAALAGIRPGDAIISVGGQSTAGMEPGSVASLIAGPEGSSLAIGWRGRDKRVRTAFVIRALVPPETVFSERIGDILVLRITSFGANTDVHLARLLQNGLATGRPPIGIVLDLRGNRGGIVRTAVLVADTFLPDGVVVAAAGRAPDSNHIWRSTEGELAEGVPLVVMVDGRTASAAEILAAALADRGRGVVIGSTTMGKGFVQTIDPLPDGGVLFVTWSRLLAPRGWPLQGFGLLPKVCTSLGPEALRRQLALLGAGSFPMRQALTRQRAARAPAPNSEVLAMRNVCPAAEGREADLEAARSLLQNPTAYASALLPPMQ